MRSILVAVAWQIIGKHDTYQRRIEPRHFRHLVSEQGGPQDFG